MPAIDISSSLVRDRVHRGLPIEELVGPAVASYIAEHGLYRDAGGHRPSRGSGGVRHNSGASRVRDAHTRGGIA